MKNIDFNTTWFKRYINTSLKYLSNNLKYDTEIDLWHWLLIIFSILGIIFTISTLHYTNYKLIDIAGSAVLYFTLIAIIWYSLETYHLKQVQQKQLKHEKSALIQKRTVDLIYKFETDIRKNFTDIMNGRLKAETTGYDDAFDRTMGYFEISGLMLKKELIDRKIYLDHSYLIIRKFFEKHESKIRSSLTVNSDLRSWENALYLNSQISNIHKGQG